MGSKESSHFRAQSFMIVIRNTCALNSREIHNAVTQSPAIWQSLGLVLQVKKVAEKLFKIMLTDINFNNDYYISTTLCTTFKDVGFGFHPF